MKYSGILLSVLFSVTTLTVAGQAKYKVDLADLAPLGLEQLETLMQEDHALTTANVMVAAAKNAEAQAKGGVKTAKRVVEAEQADKKAADAELKAAKKNQDIDRTKIAEALVANTKSDMKTANLLVKWKEQEVEARTADVGKAKAVLDLKTAELELSRAKLIAKSDQPAAEKYPLDGYIARLAQRQGEYEKAANRAQRHGTKASELKDAWVKLAHKEDFERFTQ